MSLMVNPIVAEYVNTLEQDLRIAQTERRCRALDALPTPSSQPSRRARLQSWLGEALIAAGERLRGEPRLAPAVG